MASTLERPDFTAKVARMFREADPEVAGAWLYGYDEDLDDPGGLRRKSGQLVAAGVLVVTLVNGLPQRADADTSAGGGPSTEPIVAELVAQDSPRETPQTAPNFRLASATSPESAEEPPQFSLTESSSPRPTQTRPASPEPAMPELSPLIDLNSRQPATNGDGSPIETVRIAGGDDVNAGIATDLARMIEAARTEGISLEVYSGFRSRDEQVELRREHCGTSDYAIYEMPSGECSPPTAQPGDSNHEDGNAVDFRYNGNQRINSHNNSAWQWLHENAAGYGFHNLPSEAWHWDHEGTPSNLPQLQPAQQPTPEAPAAEEEASTPGSLAGQHGLPVFSAADTETSANTISGQSVADSAERGRQEDQAILPIFEIVPSEPAAPAEQEAPDHPQAPAPQPAPRTIFPLVTTQERVRNYPELGARWCIEAAEPCHHDYWAADIGDGTGTVVRSPVYGTVISAREDSDVSDQARKGTVGSRVQIRAEDDGTLYYMAHMQDGSLQVVPGQPVEAGTIIGEIGDPADAKRTAPHLHIDQLPAEYESRPTCSADGCSGLPFVNVQPMLQEAFARLPHEDAPAPAPAPPAPEPTPQPSQEMTALPGIATAPGEAEAEESAPPSFAVFEASGAAKAVPGDATEMPTPGSEEGEADAPAAFPVPEAPAPPPAEAPAPPPAAPETANQPSADEKFNTAFDIVLGSEGGYSDHPNDPGGATNYGVTHSTYDSWRDRQGLPRQPVSQVTMDEVHAIYREYFDNAGAGELSLRESVAVFDMAINSGATRAREYWDMSGHDLNRFLDLRVQFYHDIVANNSSKGVFLEGWLNRIENLRSQINQLPA